MWRTVERRVSAIPVDVAERGYCTPPKPSAPRTFSAELGTTTAGLWSLTNLGALVLRGCCRLVSRVASCSCSCSCLCFCSSWRTTSCCTATSALTCAAGPLSTSVLECADHIGFTSWLCPITPAPGTAWSACSFGRRSGRDTPTPPALLPNIFCASSSLHWASTRTRGEPRCCARRASAVVGRLLVGVAVPSMRWRVRPTATSEIVLCSAATSVRCVGMKVTAGGGRQLRMASPHERAAATERFGPLGGKGTRASKLTDAPWFRFTDTAAGIAIMLRVARSSVSSSEQRALCQSERPSQHPTETPRPLRCA